MTSLAQDRFHFRKMQNLIDENKEQLPTGFTCEAMRICQAAYEARPKLYKLDWFVTKTYSWVRHEITDIKAVNHVVTERQVLIVKAAKRAPFAVYEWDMPFHGLILEKWLKMETPCLVECQKSCKEINCNVNRIIISIKPYECASNVVN